MAQATGQTERAATTGQAPLLDDERQCSVVGAGEEEGSRVLRSSARSAASARASRGQSTDGGDGSEGPRTQASDQLPQKRNASCRPAVPAGFCPANAPRTASIPRPISA